jgi:hypothetical protein
MGCEADVDGVVGLQTLGAINSVQPDEASDFLRRYKSKLLERYEHLARKNPGKYADDLKGWKKRLGN